MRADLHIHSVYSDGLYSPDEICKKAKSRGLSFLSITDHDTLAGEDVKRALAKKHALSYLSGWEISAYDGDQKIHILGYGCRRNDAYADFVEERKKASKLRAQDMVEKLNAIGIDLTFQEVLIQMSSPDLPVHAMHVARALGGRLNIRAEDAYMQYLAYGRVANSGVGRPTPYEAVDCIHALCGKAVIAHPGRLTMDEQTRERTLNDLFDYGADGIEAFYTTHTDKETSYFLAMAKAKNLIVTGGSDTHYENGEREIGTPFYRMDERLIELCENN